jgi:hypothetical protein
MSDERDEDEEKGFKVRDRRLFSSEGEPLEPEEAAEAEEAEASSAADGALPLPDMDFTNFVLSLFASAMAHLGEAPTMAGAVRKDLALAKQTIDILGLLREKTKGNLTPEESRILDEVLFDLQMRFVAAAK